MENHKFDAEAFREEAIKKLQAGAGLLGEDGASTPLLKSFLEEALNGELDAYLFESYPQFTVMAERFRHDFNEHHHHADNGGLPPRSLGSADWLKVVDFKLSHFG